MTLRQCVRLSQRSLLLSQRSLLLSPHTYHTTPCLSIQQVRTLYCSRVTCSPNPTEGIEPTIKRSNVRSNEEESDEHSRKTQLVKNRWNSLSKTKKVLVIIGGVLFFACYTILVTYQYLKYKAVKENDRIMRTQGRSYGKIAIGGPFDLIDAEGKRVSSESLKGNWILLYFGFTLCPDVCPEQMEQMGQLVDLAQEKLGLDMIPVMITIDCDRDTPDMIKEYLEDFHPKFIGLTGTEEQIGPPCLAYRVYRSKGQPLDNNPNDYILDHTVTQYVLNPKGETVGFFLSNRDLTERVEILEKLMKEYTEQNPNKE